jgi:hypothetical protein
MLSSTPTLLSCPSLRYPLYSAVPHCPSFLPFSSYSNLSIISPSTVNPVTLYRDLFYVDQYILSFSTLSPLFCIPMLTPLSCPPLGKLTPLTYHLLH